MTMHTMMRMPRMKIRSYAGLFLCLLNLFIVVGFYHDLFDWTQKNQTGFDVGRRKSHGENLQNSKQVTSTETPHPTKKLMDSIEATQRQRRAILREGCSSYGLNFTSDQSRDLAVNQLRGLDHVFVIPQSKVLYCAVPKVSCTSWKRLILNVTGIIDILKKQVSGNIWKTSVHDITPRFFRTLSSYHPDEVREILKTYSSFIFARNPFTRILSAYRDKFTLDPHTKWIDEMMQWVIRENPKGASDVYASRRTFNFTEFLRYYLSPVDKNPHWREYYRLCMPCHIDYDFIGNYETLSEDSAYVLHNVFNASTSFALSAAGRKTGSSADETLREFYKDVPRDLLRQLSAHDGITIDSKLFGYGVPDIVQDILNAV